MSHGLSTSSAPLPQAVFFGPPDRIVSEAVLRVNMLGGLRVSFADGHSITHFQTQKTAGLLAYLALHPGRVHIREFLIDLFWPDATLEDGRRSLRTALASLRKQLERPRTPTGTILTADRSSLTLNSVYAKTDVAEFEAASLAESAPTPELEERRLEAAIELYAGPLLPGFYDDWLLGERDRMADLYRSLLLRRSSLAEQRGGLGGALDFARRAVNMESDREAAGTQQVWQPAHISVIRLLAKTGRPDDARSHFAVLRESLQDLYGEQPSREAVDALTVMPSAADTAITCSGIAVPTSYQSEAIRHRSQVPKPRLPLALTRFFGRVAEIDRLSDAFSDPEVRLVTLTGSGGSGKTRLAVEWVRRNSQFSPNQPAFFARLADVTHLTDPSQLWLEIVSAMGLVAPEDSRNAREFALASLNEIAQPGGIPVDTDPLLILDNFEAWAEDGVPIVQSLVENVPELRVLVTSRVRLHIGGEQEIAVEPLPVPPLPGTPERLLEWASVQLFVDRAQLARSDFQMTARNAEAIAALCQRLDGIPLAIELTAAWAGTLACAQMLDRVNRHLLDEAGPPLAHRRAQRPERHRTLRAAFDYSYSLLSPDLQRAFLRLSLFRGGWTHEAAGAVLSDLSCTAEDILAGLRDHSLVIAETGPDGESIRFRLLATLQEFGDDLLIEDERHQAGLAHARYFKALVGRVAPNIGTAMAGAALETIETEHGNIRAALQFLLDHAESDGSGTDALQLAASMERFWNLRGYWDEAVTWLDRALNLRGAPTDPTDRVRALLCRGRIATHRIDFPTARGAFQEAIELCREHGDDALLGPALLGLAGVVFHADNDYAMARNLTEECLALRLKLDDQAGIASALSGLGAIAEEQGDCEGARRFYTDCMRRERDLGNQENEANALYSLGNIALNEEHFEEAQALYEEALRIYRGLGNKQRIGHSLAGLGNVAVERYQYAAARAFYEESKEIAAQLGENWAIAILLNNLGRLAYHERDLAQAESLCRESLRMRVAAGDRAGATRVLEALAMIAAADTRTLSRAATLWGAASRQRLDLQMPMVEQETSKQDKDIESVRATLGASAFNAGWTRGGESQFHDLIAFALE